ncbi:MAG: cytochrome c biogenesis protein CcdA [Chloroflexi bacterium]|nr:cytochrome c biogenesis protein CcdA [Chloroflexota bacterium]
MTPAHFQEWEGYGGFFLVVASLQAFYGLGFLLRRARLATSPWYLVGGILGSLLVIEVYAVSRIFGTHLLGPHAGHGDEIGAIDALSKALELGLVVTLATMLVRLPGFKPSFGAAARLATVVFLSVSVALVLAGVFTREEREDFRVFSQPELTSSSGAPAQALPTRSELWPLLLRGGYGTGNTSLDVLYSPPLLFQVEKEEPPASSLERPTVIFFMFEADHEHDVGLPPQPPRLLLRVDGGKLIEPYEVTVLRGSAQGEHRTSRLLFPLPSRLDPATMDREEHTLTLVSPLGSVSDRMFSWQLPLGLGGEASRGASSTTLLAEAATLPTAEGLTRTVRGLAYGDKSGLTLQATYATSQYFAAALPAESALRYLPGDFTVLAVSETAHTSNLPADPVTVSLRLDGQTYQPDMVEQIVTSSHHRVTLVRFPAAPPAGLRHRTMELQLPEGEKLVWHFPINLNGLGPASGFQLTWLSILAVLGGLVAAMWPCLFQLTVFFIPTLAGISMQEASSSVPLRRRFQVVKAAFFFVLGFTLVYTAAGATIGFLAERLVDTPDFAQWQRYIGIGGGIIILALAVRVAAKARAPLVCKMPVLSKMAHSKQAAGPLELMFAGLAFATGCMTCFGAALVVAMVVYVGLAGSAALGALILFLFSLGMGIPLVIAATAMAKVLPMLFRLEKIIPWLGLASSLLMAGFAILLITGNYMALTEWVYRSLPVLYP